MKIDISSNITSYGTKIYIPAKQEKIKVADVKKKLESWLKERRKR